jgi:hypothetical protein
VKLPLKSSHLLSGQVIENERFNFIAVIQYSINRVSYFDCRLTLTPGSSSGVPINSIPADSKAALISRRV